jgi:purine-binding chemotaxis protein CheW
VPSLAPKARAPKARHEKGQLATEAEENGGIDMEERPSAKDPGAVQQHVIFHLGETLFGVEIHQMLRIVRLAPVTRVPHAPPFLEGVINDRGQVVPVVDLHKRLGLPVPGYDDRARILIAELGAQPVGMLVDAVAGIWRLPGESIQPPPEKVAQVDSVYLTGVAHYRNRVIVLLDLGRVLTVQEIDELDAWQARGSQP